MQSCVQPHSDGLHCDSLLCTLYMLSKVSQRLFMRYCHVVSPFGCRSNAGQSLTGMRKGGRLQQSPCSLCSRVQPITASGGLYRCNLKAMPNVEPAWCTVFEVINRETKNCISGLHPQLHVGSHMLHGQRTCSMWPRRTAPDAFCL